MSATTDQRNRLADDLAAHLRAASRVTLTHGQAVTAADALLAEYGSGTPTLCPCGCRRDEVASLLPAHVATAAREYAAWWLEDEDED